ncbi:SNF2 family N-terminal domain-containing protein [Chytridium lagenaria]|nr:SNF2 family N-terminal domain-containing protein [Chytridium lagenaria]
MSTHGEPGQAKDQQPPEAGLAGLVVGITDQSQLERQVEMKLIEDLKKKDDADDQKRLDKNLDMMRRLQAEMDVMIADLQKPALKVSQKEALRERIKKSERRIAMLKHEESQVKDRLRKRADLAKRRKFWAEARNESASSSAASSSSHRTGVGYGSKQRGPVTILPSLPDITEPATLAVMDPDVDETERDFLIRTGKITPFASVTGMERGFTAVQKSEEECDGNAQQSSSTSAACMSDVVKDRSIADLTAENQRAEEALLTRQEGTSRRRRLRRLNEAPVERALKKKRKRASGSDDGEDDDGDRDSDADYVPSESGGEEENVDIEDEDEDEGEEGNFGKPKIQKDDGDELFYERRLQKWLRIRRIKRLKDMLPEGEDIDEEEDVGIRKILYEDPHLEPLQRTKGDVEFDGGLTTCVRWLWELYCQKVGGIIGDEMGLGKTVQIIAFLSALSRSNLLKNPVLIVCPATVLRQWCNEFHSWWPYFRVAILHSSGSGLASSANLAEQDDDEEDDPVFEEVKSKKQKRRKQDTSSDSDSEDDGRRRRGQGKKKKKKMMMRTTSAKTAKQVANLVKKNCHIVVTTFEGLRVHRKYLLPVQWAYCVLDEGHKIRNPDADVTLACKQVKTPNRIILSGTPIQNNLKELWSLYDFVYPGRLGTLPVFSSQFEVPIRIGAYSNASLLQVQTAHRCASVLRNLISPYLLRRMKADVASDLPKKSEQVLFCKLSDQQRMLYERYLDSRECRQILDGRRNALSGIDILRKICNHPDLTRRAEEREMPDFGNPERSGKLQVVRALLGNWTNQGHRTLVFCQTRQMLDIVEAMIKEEGHKYRRMDGTTAIRGRIGMVDEFIEIVPYLFFLLTTRVGGLGINLTGANRVIIFDPDWNPSTDIQARERAWRLGQTKEVVVYRLMMSGTIEEKIYHRQIYKQFLTNQILQRDASSAGRNTKRFFDSRSLFNLFSLGDENMEGGTETGDMFKGTEKVVGEKKEKGKHKVKVEDSLGGIELLDKVEDYQVAHDRIMDASGSKADEAMVAEATRVADEASRELKRSRQMVRMEQRRAAEREGGQFAGVLTWTGNRGSAGSSSRMPPLDASTRPGSTGPAGRSPVASSASGAMRHRESGERSLGGPTSGSLVVGSLREEAKLPPPKPLGLGIGNGGTSSGGSQTGGGMSSSSLLAGLRRQQNQPR